MKEVLNLCSIRVYLNRVQPENGSLTIAEKQMMSLCIPMLFRLRS